MSEELGIKEAIKNLIQRYFALKSEEKFIHGKTKIPLNVPSYGWKEVCESLDSLLDAKVTMGEKVKVFENIFAKYIGTKHAIMVNSGSSANLLALSALSNPLVKNRLQPREEIITPAVTWATTVYPILNVGAIPVFVDIDLETFTLKPEEIEKGITPKTKAIMLVHLLGNPCEMDEIMEIAQGHDLFIIEDACEAHGAEYKGKKVGSFGNLATFSFFFAHHISTIEGGMLLTNNEEFAELAKALRVFGWIRDLKDKEKIAKDYNYIDSRYIFYNVGYNLRPTEIQGAFGIHQMKKLENYIAIRRENAEYWYKSLSHFSDYILLHKERKGTRHVWYGYPITIQPSAPFTREDLTSFLESKGVETRPIMAGNIVEQPVTRLFPYRKVGELPNSKLIMRNSFFFGNHHGISKIEREAIVVYINEFITMHT